MTNFATGLCGALAVRGKHPVNESCFMKGAFTHMTKNIKSMEFPIRRRTNQTLAARITAIPKPWWRRYIKIR